MGASERVAALRRSRQRQARIEAATARAINAQTSVTRAIQAKEIAMQRCDEHVAVAESRSETEVAELVKVCGSSEAAAEILGWSIREVRRALKSARERRTSVGGTDVGV